MNDYPYAQSHRNRGNLIYPGWNFRYISFCEIERVSFIGLKRHDNELVPPVTDDDVSRAGQFNKTVCGHPQYLISSQMAHTVVHGF